MGDLNWHTTQLYMSRGVGGGGYDLFCDASYQECLVQSSGVHSVMFTPRSQSTNSVQGEQAGSTDLF
jgi:hypothetical protein